MTGIALPFAIVYPFLPSSVKGIVGPTSAFWGFFRVELARRLQAAGQVRWPCRLSAGNLSSPGWRALEAQGSKIMGRVTSRSLSQARRGGRRGNQVGTGLGQGGPCGCAVTCICIGRPSMVRSVRYRGCKPYWEPAPFISLFYGCDDLEIGNVDEVFWIVSNERYRVM